MIVFHRTSREAASAIAASGFRDSTGYYMTNREWTGVWISDKPLDANEGAADGPLLSVELDDVATDRLPEFEWVQEGLSYREWLVPAELLNLHGRVTVDEDDIF